MYVYAYINYDFVINIVAYFFTGSYFIARNCEKFSIFVYQLNA